MTDVFVQRFPEGGGRLKASVDGGGTPFWSPDGTRLYYLTVRPNAADSEVFEITFDGSGSTPVLGRPRTLFEVETISP